jgi:hypothetical protein
VQAVDVNTPSLARAYDYMLGGRAHFAADRALATRLRELYPAAPALLSLARTSTVSAVTTAARARVRQFIDVGSGLPTWPSVHAAALGAEREARVIYVDRDPGVVSHAAALVPAGVRVVEGDLAEPEALLWSLRSLLDLNRPACLILSLIVQALDLGTARAVTSVLVRALAPGSHVLLTGGAGEAGKLPDTVSGAGLTATDVEAFLAGLDIQPPGVQQLPAGPGPSADGAPVVLLSAVGRKP